MVSTLKIALLSCLAKEKSGVQREDFMQCSFLYLAQVAKLDHMLSGKDTCGKGSLFCFLLLLFLQEWRMITARIYTYIFKFNTLN